MKIRPLADDDLPAVAKIALANDDHDGADPRYVRHQREHGRFLAAVTDGTVTDGTVAGGTVAGYGAVRRIGDATMLCDLFVDPARHGSGTGRRLLAALFEDAGERFTFASQDPKALSLYARHGMVPRWPLLYLAGPPGGLCPAAPSLTCERVPASRAAAAELRWSGADRGADYGFWAQGPGGAAVIVRDGHEIVAAGATTADRVCHLVTAPGRDASATLAAVMRGTFPGAFPGAAATPGGTATVRLCLPGPHPALAALLEAGWRIEDFDHHMSSRPGLVAASSVLYPALA